MWDPKKDGDGLDGSGSTSIEKLLESRYVMLHTFHIYMLTYIHTYSGGGDSMGGGMGLPMVRPGDAS